MRRTAKHPGATAKGKSKPFTVQGLRKPVLVAGLALASSAAMLGTSLASAPLNESTRSERRAPASEPAQLLPITRYAAVPSDNFVSTGLPATLPALTPPPFALPDQVTPQVQRSDLPEPKMKGAFPRGLHPVIKHAMVEASRYLPEGWQLEFMNALRDAPGVWNGPHGKRDKTGGALAVDVWLVNPKGERLCNFKCVQNFEPYQTFMQMVKFIQDRDFPAYKSQGRWGGYFGGSYANDEMHYDLEPSAWVAAGSWEKGLFPQYANFGKKGDVGKGMGQIASYRLPTQGTLASMETPPVATPANPPAKVAVVQVPVAAPIAAPIAPPAAAQAPAAAPAPVAQIAPAPALAPAAASVVAAAPVVVPAAPMVVPVAIQAVVVKPVAAMTKPAVVRSAKAAYRKPTYRARDDDDDEPRSFRVPRFESEMQFEAQANRARVRYANNTRATRRATRAVRDFADD